MTWKGWGKCQTTGQDINRGKRNVGQHVSLELRSMSQCLLLSFRCGMWFFSVFISFSFLSVNFPADMWLVDLVWADVQKCIPKHWITLCNIPWHLMLCGLGPLFLVRLCSRSSKAGGTALALLLVHSWGFIRWYLWVSGRQSSGIGEKAQWGLEITFSICNQCTRAFGAHL